MIPHARLPAPPVPGLLLGVDRDEAEGWLEGPSLYNHWHVPGASQSGKSSFLNAVLAQLLLSPGAGFSVTDPHGSVVDRQVDTIGRYGLHGRRPIYLLDAGSDEIAFSLNPLAVPPGGTVAVTVDLAVSAVVQVAGDDIAAVPRVRSTLRHTFTALCELGLSLCEAGIFLWDEAGEQVRTALVAKIASPATRRFFEQLYRLPVARRDERLESTVSRIQPFLSNPYVRRIFGHPERALDLAKAMDEGACILLKIVPDGLRLSHEDVRLIGCLYANMLFAACFRRQRPDIPHFDVKDECQYFLTEAVAASLDETLKMGLRLILAHQHLGHLREAGERIYRSVMTNARIKCVFGGLDTADATIMGENLFRGYFDLERPKKKLIRPQQVGVERGWLSNESRGTGSAFSAGTAWSDGMALALSDSATASRSTTASQSETDSVSATASRARTVTAGWNVSETTGGGSHWSDSESSDEDGDAVRRSSTEGGSSSDSTTNGRSGSVAETEGEARTTGHSVTRGTAETEGLSRTAGATATASRQEGGSRSHTSSRHDARGRAEALFPVYEMVVTDTYNLPELVHLAAVSVGNVRQGEFHVRVGARRPHRLMAPFLRARPLLPALRARVARLLQSAAPCSAPVALVEEEIERRARTVVELASARRPAPTPSRPLPAPAAPAEEAGQDEDEGEDDEAWQRLTDRREP